MSTPAARIPHVLRAVSVLALLAGSATSLAQPVSWVGGCSNGWLSSCTNGVCPNNSTLYFNNFGQNSCGGPVFPGPSNNVLLGANDVILAGGTVNVASMQLDSGGVLTWANVTCTLGSVTNAGTINVISGDRSLFNSSISSSGTIVSDGPLLYFRTLAVTNSGLLDLRLGEWQSYDGTNSISSSGVVRKTTAGLFTIRSMPLSITAGAVDVQTGTMLLQSCSASFGSGTTVQATGTSALVFRACNLGGRINGSRSSGAFLGVDGGNWGVPATGLTLNIASPGFQWTASDLFLNGNALANAGGGVLSVTGGDRSTYSGTIANNGLLDYDAGIWYFRTLTLTNNASARLLSGEWQSYDGTNALINNGLLDKSGSGNAVIRNLPFSNSGVIGANQGSLLLQGVPLTLSPGNSIAVAGGASMSLRACSLSGVLNASVAPTGFLGVDGSNWALSSDLAANVTGKGFEWTASDLFLNNYVLTNNASSLITISGGDRSTYSGAIVNRGRLVYDAGIHYFRTLAYSNASGGATELRSGEWQSYDGSNSINNNGTVRKTGGGEFVLRSMPISTAGRLDVEGGNLTARGCSITFNPGSSSSIAPGANFYLQGCSPAGTLTASVGAGSYLGVNASNWSLADNFTLQATGSGFQWSASDLFLNGHALINGVGSLFTISGGDHSTFNGSMVNRGTLVYDAGIEYFRTLAFGNAPGATTEWRSGQWQSYDGANSASNDGLIRKTGAGTFLVNALSTTNSGRLSVEGGSLIYQSAAINFSLGGTVDVAPGATMNLRGCTLQGVLIGTASGYLGVDSGNWSLSDNLTLAHSGAFNWSTGNLFLNGRTLTTLGASSLVIAGDHDLFSGAIVNNANLDHAAGILYFRTLALTNNGQATLQAGQWLSYDGPNSANNAGTITKIGPGTHLFNGLSLGNSGQIRIQSGALQFNNSALVQSAGRTALEGGSIVGNVSLTGGVLTGAGAISGSVSNSGGSVAPGAPTGQMQLGGTYTQGAGGTLAVTLDSAGSSRLDVAGGASISGVLNVRASQSAPPALGQQFTILTGHNVSGTFAGVTGDSSVSISYASTSVTITYNGPSGCQADFNGDGFVDPDDLSDYISCFFSMPPCPGADFNRDTFIDPDDLSDYIALYFAGC